MRGESGSCRFHDIAQFEQAVEQLQIRFRLEGPVEHIRIKQMPLRSWIDARTHLRTGVDQALGREYPHRFAISRARYRKLRRGADFAAEQIPRAILAGYDQHA